MSEVNRENQPTYEELLEFRKKHLGWQQEYLVLVARRDADEEEYKANLSRTWTGRLVLLAHKLDIDWVAILAFAVLLSANFWIAVCTIISCCLDL